MRKIIICAVFLLWTIPFIFGLNLDVEKQSSNEVLVLGTNQYATFDLKLTNLGESDKITFYNLVGFEMLPSGPIFIDSGETKNIQLKIYPIGELKNRGGYLLHYFIRGQNSSEIELELPFMVVDLEDAFELGAGEINSESDSIEVYLHNKVNFDFDSLNIKFISQFFDYEESFSLKPNKRKDFSIQLTKENFKKLTAGFYTLIAEININNKSILLESPIKFVGKDILKTETDSKGIFISTQTVRKVNEGNVLTRADIVLEKNIISRLFTSFNINPDLVKREGFAVYYFWNKDLKPSETLEIIIKTNWILPFFVTLLIIFTIVLVKQYSKTNLVLRKKITFVKAKGGEFALKVSIFIHARKYIENVNLIDKLPPLTKVHEKFGVNKPLRVDDKNRRIEWSFEKLEEGETRVLSYFIYSKIGILGKFALPTATAIYERNGKLFESRSNRSFFVSEQRKRDSED